MYVSENVASSLTDPCYTCRRSEEDPSEVNEDSSSKKHKKKKKKKKKKRWDEEKPHTERDSTYKQDEHEYRSRNGGESRHLSSESTHSSSRDHQTEDQQQLNGHKGISLISTTNKIK